MPKRQSDLQAQHDAFRESSLTCDPAHKLHRLDFRLGYGVGAKRERERIKRALVAEWREKYTQEAS